MKSKQKPMLKLGVFWSFTFFILFGTSFCKTASKDEIKTTKTTQNAAKNIPSSYEIMTKVKLLEIKEDDIIGIWKPEKEDFKVEIYKDDGDFSGKIIWMKNPNGKNGQPILDKLNPQRNRRAQPILGLEMAERFEFNSYDKNWEDGMIYNPMTGETMKCTIKMLDKDTLELVGFVGFSLSEIKVTWKRVDAE